MTRGSVVPGNEQIGGGVASLGDISGDGIGDFAVQWGVDGRWRVYYGSDSTLSTTPNWISPPFLFHPPVVGNFWGGQRKGIVFFRHYDNDIGSAQYFQINLFDIDAGVPRTAPTVVKDSLFNFGDLEIVGSDLDGNGADELIVSHIGYHEAPEIWIFKGQADLKWDMPGVILHDPEKTSDAHYHMIVGDFDGDHKSDILTAGDYPDGQKLKFWFSSLSGSVWDWDQPNRVVTLTGTDFPRISFDFTAVDCDGDGIMDLLLASANNGPMYLYRSNNATKLSTTRSFSLDDADAIFDLKDYTTSESLGYLNDSHRRYGMFALFGPSPSGLTMLAFGGGANGPDHNYDAFYTPGLDTLGTSVFQYDAPLMDVNGDGWDDFICGNPEWNASGVHKPGIAVILAGGPYIPRDSVWLGVREIAAEDRGNAISIWPTPATDELNIAWRGDLARMPERFVVYDALGRRVAEGSAGAGRGSVVWKCVGEPAGLYLLAILDRNSLPIATARVIKR